MNFLENLPPEWQYPYCPGNGHGLCGAGLSSEKTYSPINSCWVIRRVCLYGHSKEAVIPVEIVERPITKGKWGHNIIDPKPQQCGECPNIFVPYSNHQKNCPDSYCRDYRRKRNAYMGHLMDSRRIPKRTRKYAKYLALKKYPRLKDKPKIGKI